jgi:4-hydroxy-tetrahydrodipicolinate synthase
MKLSGYAPALPTPFTEDEGIDAEAFERICHLQILHGATALVVGGTTGEASTLRTDEHTELIRIAAVVSRGRVPVIAGAGSNTTAHAIELSTEAETNGADAILSVVPYYNKPTQEGLYAHYREIATSTGLPIILYDDPSRTVRGLADETIARLAQVPGIIGLKDATGDVGRVSRLRALVGSQFRLISGDDATALGYLAQGGDGCISVAANVAPGLCRNMYLAFRQGNVTRARRLMLSLTQLTAALFRETNPAPVKCALSLCGLTLPKVRLPLVEASEETRRVLSDTLERLHDEYTDALIERFSASTCTRRLAASALA